MARRRFDLYRDKTPDDPVSNLAILGYALPSIGIFLLLAVLIADPFIGLLSILHYAELVAHHLIARYTRRRSARR